MSEQFKFVTSAIGIFVCYFYFGILHEKITRGWYGDEQNEDGTKGERFTFSLTLVGMQIGFNWVFVKGIKFLDLKSSNLKFLN
jgi:UDP-galactose transporter B1